MRTTPQLVILEIRDRGTHISAMAIKMNVDSEAGFYHVHFRCGYSMDGSTVILMKLETAEAQNNPFKWGRDPRTMFEAHYWIQQHFDDLTDGDVIDVEFILGETKVKKISERLR